MVRKSLGGLAERFLTRAILQMHLFGDFQDLQVRGFEGDRTGVTDTFSGLGGHATKSVAHRTLNFHTIEPQALGVDAASLPRRIQNVGLISDI
jgi:hypothetical protein